MMCSPIDPDIACYERVEAERDGSFYFEPTLGAWVRNNHPGVITRCPWCSGDLPDPENIGDDGLCAPVAPNDGDDLPWGFGFEEPLEEEE